jgi:hypothetical protein
MADDIAVQIIATSDVEKAKADNFMSLYQQFADLGYPVENQITSKRTPGEDKSLDIRDPTAIFALDKATSNFIGAWIPRERYFFGIKPQDKERGSTPNAKMWCAKAVEQAHDYLFGSNYMMQKHNTIKSCIGFGTGNSYCEWSDKKQKLVFRDWHVSQYTFKQDEEGMVDTMILRYDRTARQLCDKFDDPGDDVIKAAEKLENESKLFSVIHIVRPRIRKTYKLINKMNMPWESVYVNVKEKKVMQTGGYEEFPFSVPRWEQGSCEKWGRGRGLAMLSFIKELQQMRKDYMEACNRWNHSPYEVIKNNIEGEVNLKPDGRTDVYERDSVRPISPQLNGNIPITVEALEEQRKIIKEGFYMDVFSQFGDLKGDRRTTIEIELKYKESMRQLISPVSSIENEGFTPELTRVINILIRKGKISPPPPELRGQNYGIEYMGELAMAMRDLQARGFERGMTMVTNMAAVFPEVRDEINLGRAMPDILVNYGMKSEHLNTEDEKAELKQKRAQEEAQMKMAAATQVASDAYHKTKDKPETGSPAGQLMGTTS